MLDLYKIVLRDQNGKVIQIHETVGIRGTANKVKEELQIMHPTSQVKSITITLL